MIIGFSSISYLILDTRYFSVSVMVRIIEWMKRGNNWQLNIILRGVKITLTPLSLFLTCSLLRRPAYLSHT